MAIELESLSVIGKVERDNAIRHDLRYTKNMIDYEGIWIWQFEDMEGYTVNVTSPTDGAIFFEKVNTYDDVKKYVAKVFNMLKI